MCFQQWKFHNYKQISTYRYIINSTGHFTINISLCLWVQSNQSTYSTNHHFRCSLGHECWYCMKYSVLIESWKMLSIHEYHHYCYHRHQYQKDFTLSVYFSHHIVGSNKLLVPFSFHKTYSLMKPNHRLIKKNWMVQIQHFNPFHFDHKISTKYLSI
jgi:hypothetical protein